VHTAEEAATVCDTVDEWQEIFLTHLGRRMVFASDEYYLVAGRPLPPAASYGEFSMHEDGIGMVRAFELEFDGETGDEAIGVQPGFFAWVDGAPAEGYRAPRVDTTTSASSPASTGVALRPRRTAPVGVLTGVYGAKVLSPLVGRLGRDDVRVIPVASEFFGGNVGVAGLMVGADLQRVLASEPVGHRYLLPDVCLSQGRFLDGLTPEDLPRAVEVIATDGVALRKALV
jgi:NifB/MoaA-like Fe-S oxidoreductase